MIVSVCLISGITINSFAEGQALPSWIKTIAGFWSQDQISDDEFVGALQYLVKEGILVIPTEVQNDLPIQKDDVSDTSPVPSPNLSQKLTPQMNAAYLQGDNLLVLVSLTDPQGNTVESNGEFTLKFLDEDDHELFSEKKYLTNDVFQEKTNDVSGETITAIQYNIGKGKFRDTNWSLGWYQGYEDIYVQLIFTDTAKTTQTNYFSLSHLPLNEGYFGEDTGFVKTYETNGVLNVGPFFIKISQVGPYMSDFDGLDDQYFRVNLETQYKQVSNVIFTIDEMYILDDKNNLYSPEEDSFDDLKKAFLIDNGYVLFEDIPSSASKITVYLKITVIELDDSDTVYQDNAEITLK